MPEFASRRFLFWGKSCSDCSAVALGVEFNDHRVRGHHQTDAEQVRGNEHVVSAHARKEMLDDDLNIDDVEMVVLTGAIVDRQRCRVTAEWRYRLHGEATDG